MSTTPGEQSGAPKLELVKFRILGKSYSKWRAIITEATGESDTLFKLGLYQAHNIRIDDPLADPMVYIVQDTAQMRELAEQGVGNPTLCQLLMSTKIIDLSEQGAIDRMNDWLESNRVKIE